VGKPEGNRQLARGNNIKMKLQGTKCRVWNGFIWLRIGEVEGACEDGD